MKRPREIVPHFIQEQDVDSELYSLPPAVLLYSGRVGGHVGFRTELEEQAEILSRAERVDARLAAVSFIVQRIDFTREMHTKRFIVQVAKRQLGIETESLVLEGLVKILCTVALLSCSAQKSGNHGDGDKISSEVVWALVDFVTGKNAEILTLKSSMKVAVFRSLLYICKAVAKLELKTFQPIFEEQLADRNPRLRELGIRLLVQAVKKRDSLGNDERERMAERESESLCKNRAEVMASMRTFLRCSRDPYPNVREAAVAGVLELHYEGFELDLGAYKAAVARLGDSSETVRINAIKLIGVCAEALMWGISDTVQSKFTDNAFLQICNMMTDMAMKVRKEACNVLAEMTGVSGSILLQSLARKVLTKPAAEKASTASVGSDSVSNIDSSSVYDFLDDFKLFDWSAAGAFVIGLEDEFWEVRSAAVMALGKLGKLSKTMANGALELLIDMINDPSSHVRKQAIRSLSDIACVSRLSVLDSQLHMFIGILEDPSSDMRRLGHGLLSAISISNVTGFQLVIQAIFKSLETYRKDETSLLQTLHALGKSHHTYSEFIACDLVQEMKVLLNGDTGLDEPLCKGILALLLSAASVNEKVISTIPSQLSFLPRLLAKKLPGGLPMLQVVPMGFKVAQYNWCPSDGLVSSHSENREARDEVTKNLDLDEWHLHNTAKVRDFEKRGLASAQAGSDQVLSRVTAGDQECDGRILWEDDVLESAKQIMEGAVGAGSLLESKAYRGLLQKISACRLELNALKGKASTVGEVLTFCSLYLQGLTCLVQLRAHSFSQDTRLLVRKSGYPHDVLNRLLSTVKHLLNTFIGYNFEQVVGVVELSAVANMWKLALDPVFSDDGRVGPTTSTLNELKYAYATAQTVTVDNGLPPSLLLKSVQDQILKVEQNNPQELKLPTRQRARQLALSYWPRVLSLPSSVRQMTAVMSAPGKDFDQPLGFVAGMPLCIPVDVTVFNVPQEFSVWVRFARDTPTPSYRLLDVEKRKDTSGHSRQFSALLYLDKMPAVATSVCRIGTVLEGLDGQELRHGDRSARGPKGSILPLSRDTEIHLAVMKEKSAKQPPQGRR